MYFSIKAIPMSEILIVEDHALLRTIITELVRAVVQKAVIIECTTCEDMKTILRKKKFDLLILNIGVPDCNSSRMIKTLLTSQKGLAILVLSTYMELDYPVRFLKAGAMGYADKSASSGEIKTAIRKVLNHERYISPAIMEQMSDLSPIRLPYSVKPVLSKREQQVLKGLIKGNSSSTIGAQLGLKLSTVSTYKLRVLKKMKVHNIVQLIEKVKSGK